MYISRTVVKRSLDADGDETDMPVYSLELTDHDAATSSAVWRESSLTTKTPPFFERLIKATVQAVELMTAEHSERVENAQTPAEVSGMFELRGAHQRLFLMGMSVNCAVTLTKAVLGEVPVEVDEELVSDCVGELCNIIVGRMRSQVDETEGFEMSTPIVVFSDRPRIHWQAQADIYEAHFTSAMGAYTLRLLTHT